MGKVKMQNNLNFSLGATTVDSTTETLDDDEIITTITQYVQI